MNKKSTGPYRLNATTGILAVLATGVLTGCDYCAPVLLVAVTGVIAYRLIKPIHQTMQIKPY